MATGRLTADLILRSPQHLDPTTLYSLDLRGAYKREEARQREASTPATFSAA